MTLHTIDSKETLIGLIHEIGFLPFFKNEVPGFSIEEWIEPRFWFPDEGEGVWEWKGDVIREAGAAYGKFFRGKAGFVSGEWFPDFANFRRDGYDFDALCDDGFGRHSDIRVYNVLAEHGSLSTKEFKALCGIQRGVKGAVTGRGAGTGGSHAKDGGGKSRFEGIITRLQAECYVVISTFEYQQALKIAKCGFLELALTSAGIRMAGVLPVTRLPNIILGAPSPNACTSVSRRSRKRGLWSTSHGCSQRRPRTPSWRCSKNCS